MGQSTGLTALERSFVAIERPGVPMHVGGLVIVEGGDSITMSELRAMVSSRLRRLPKFRQRVSGGFGRPRWTPVRRISFSSHLFHHTLRAPGTMPELFALCARIHEELLSRERPLWEMHLIDGLPHGRQALLIKTHHAVTDGLAGVELAEVLFDPAPGRRRAISLPSTRFAGGPAQSRLSALQALLGLAFTTASGPLALHGPFNGPVGAHRAFAGVTIPLEVVRRAKRRLGGSVDDVVAATVAAGLRQYLIDSEFPDMPHAVRAMLPVSTRVSSRGVHLGNHVTSIFVDLPLDTSDLGRLVRVIATTKATLRSAHAAAGSSLLVEAAALLPHPLHSLALGVFSGLPVAHLVLSDVPGPDEQLYLLGRRIVACFPLMPLTGSIGLSIAAVTMGGVMGIGVTVDPDLVPDPKRLTRAIEHAIVADDHAGRRAA